MRTSAHPTPTELILRPIAGLFLLAFLSLAGANTTSAQGTPTDGKTPSGLQPGSPAGSYALSGFENVNLFNGSLSFRLPLLKVGGRGSAGFTVTLPFEQKWQVRTGETSPFGVTPRSPNPNWWEGVKPGYGAGVLQGRRATHELGRAYETFGGGESQTLREVTLLTLTRLTFTASDGTEFELRDAATGGQPMNDAWKRETGNRDGFDRGKVFVTADGTAATFVADAPIRDRVAENMSLAERLIYPSGVLMLNDGTRYRIDAGRVTSIRDRNGNTVSLNEPDCLAKDSLGRKINVTRATVFTRYDEIAFNGAGGAPRTLLVRYDTLKNRLRPNSGYSIQTYYALFPLNSASTSTDYNPSDKIAEVVLPDGRGYQFYYNPYGELARVVLPTGGAIEYDWAGGVFDPEGDAVIFRYVTERRTYPNANSSAHEGRTVYTRAAPTGLPSPVTVDSYAGKSLVSRSVHYFHGDAFTSLLPDPSKPGAVAHSPWREGREYKTEIYATNGSQPTALLRRTETVWQQPAAGKSWPLTEAEASEDAKPNNPQITEVKSTLADTNQVSRQTFAYDRYSNRTDVWEFDYGTEQAGSLLRRSQTSFVTGLNGHDYVCDPATTCAAQTVASGITAAVIHLRSLPARRSVYDAAGVERARTVYEYDNYNAQPNHAALVTRPGITALDAAFADPGRQTRGNVTATTNFADAAGQTGAVTSYAQYDVAGNVVRSIDARGNAATVGYADSFCNGSTCGGTYAPNTFAFPTGTTSAAPAPSPGPYAGRGSATPLTSSAVYDYWTGQIRSWTDANSKVTSYEYDDVLDRLTKVNRPDGGWTDYFYGRDSVGDYVRTRTALNTSQHTEGYQFFDGLGRSVRSFKHDGSSWLTTDTQYDALGRVWRVSAEPYLAPGGSGSPVSPPSGWVETSYDALGRATHMKTTADGAQVVTSYVGNQVTVTDQAGRQRRSVSDALGRLTQVVEAPSIGSCQPDGAGCPTNYTYDALDNLRRVDQGGQQRFFMYDSLSRLVRARNPEHGINGALNTTADPWSGNTQWSLGYAYDANSNIYQRTDARGVTTTYAYDNLNRLIRTDYSDGTPFTLLTYDHATNGRGRFYANYESSTEGTINYVTAYDDAGRPASGKTEFYVSGPEWLPPYVYSRAYDKAGNITSQTYPSGHIVSYNYDVAGRLADSGTNAAFSGNLGDGAARAYSSAVSYDGAGRMRQERFGTQTPLYHKRHFNVRGQLYDVRLSTVAWQPNGAGQWDWNRGAVVLWYGNLGTPEGGSSADNNGNVVKSHSSVPLNGLTSEYSYHEQRYAYDSLDRLVSVTEQAGTQAGLGGVYAAQAYSYDRWGNRQINAGATWLRAQSDPPDQRVNETQFGLEEAATSNRLLAPGDAGQAEANRRMRYDAAGNLVKDTYTGSGGRTYDAENRMTSAWGHSSTLGGPHLNRYVYDAAGKRVRRKIDSGEVWQVYGFDGELIAEYPASGAPAQPRKEYGYRAGELLVVAESGGGYSSGAASGFSAAQNPAGPWAYGYKSSGGQFTQLAAASTIFGAGTATWSPQAQSCCPSVTKATTGSTHQYPNAPSVIQPADTLNLHPGPAGERSVVRWTAPQAGSYTISGRFQGIDTFGTTTDVRIEHNGAAIFLGQVSGYGTQVPFTLTRTVAVGDTVEFSAGYGANSSYDSDSTGLAATVTRSGSQAEVRWLVPDHLGTPRMTADQTGNLDGITRHDYLPFGEEVQASTGSRTQEQGYTSDSLRQKFTSYERDAETGLDYAQQRFCSSAHGRFTSTDPILLSQSRIGDPQTLNLYGYARNNPLKYTDPTGEEIIYDSTLTEEQKKSIQEAIARLRQQSESADKAFGIFDKLNGEGPNLVIGVLDEKTFAAQPGVTEKTLAYTTHEGGVLDGDNNYIISNARIDFRASSLSKSELAKDSKDRAGGRETKVEGILSHEAGHARDVALDRKGVEQRHREDRNLDYHDRRNEVRADGMLSSIRAERFFGGHIPADGFQPGLKFPPKEIPVIRQKK